MRIALLSTVLTIAHLVVASPAAAQNINITKDRIQFSDGTQQSSAAPTTSTRTMTVSPTIGDATMSGQTLRDAIDAIALANDATVGFPYYVILEPGMYDVGATTLEVPEFVNLRGAGMSATRIRGNPVSSSTDPVLRTNGNGVISDLSLRHKGGAGLNGRIVIAGGESMRFQNVKFEVRGTFNSGATLTALSTTGGCKAVLVDCVIEIPASSTNGAAIGVAVGASPSDFTANGLSINIDPGATPFISVGIWATNSDDVNITNASIRVTPGSSFTAAVFGDTTSLIRIRNSVVEATGGNVALDGSTGADATPIRVLSSQIIGTWTGDDLILRNCVDGSFDPIFDPIP